MKIQYAPTSEVQRITDSDLVSTFAFVTCVRPFLQSKLPLLSTYLQELGYSLGKFYWCWPQSPIHELTSWMSILTQLLERQEKWKLYHLVAKVQGDFLRKSLGLEAYRTIPIKISPTFLSLAFDSDLIWLTGVNEMRTYSMIQYLVQERQLWNGHILSRFIHF